MCYAYAIEHIYLLRFGVHNIYIYIYIYIYRTNVLCLCNRAHIFIEIWSPHSSCMEMFSQVRLTTNFSKCSKKKENNTDQIS